MEFLRCTDQFEIMVTQAVIRKVFTIIEEHDEALSTRIANAVVRAMGG